MNIEYNPFEDIKMPKMYSYTGEYYIDYDKLSIAGHRRPEIFTMYKHKGFIGIDGGVFDDGRLNGIVIDEDGALLDYYYARDFNIQEKNLAKSYTFYPDDYESTNNKNKR